MENLSPKGVRIVVLIGWGEKMEFGNHDFGPQKPGLVISGQTKDFLMLTNCENDTS